jgi:hypothetical protein
VKTHPLVSGVATSVIVPALWLAFVALAATRPVANAIGDHGPPPSQAAAGALAPIDPQRWQDQEDMTWNDDHPIPGVNWADPSLVAGRKLRVALMALDFPDQPFVITMPKQSDLVGNPQIDPIRREDVPRFYADFLGKPGAINHGHTINGYWASSPIPSACGRWTARVRRCGA